MVCAPRAFFVEHRAKRDTTTLHFSLFIFHLSRFNEVETTFFSFPLATKMFQFARLTSSASR